MADDKSPSVDFPTPVSVKDAPTAGAQIDPTNTAAAMYGDTSADGKPLPFKPNVQIGRSGLKQYAGFVLEEFLPTLRGAQGAKAYREILDNCALVQGIFKQIQLSMRQVKKHVQPFENTAEDEKRAERVEQALDDMSDSWEDVISEACTMIPYGYAPMEIVYKKCGGWTDDPKTRSRYDDGLISWRKVALRAQDTLFKWEFDAEGGVRAMVQLPPPDFILRTIPIEKLLLFRPSVENGNPEGYSALRSAYFDWIMVKRLTEFEAIKGERSATGVPVIYTPSENLNGTTAANVSALAFAKKTVKNIRVDDQMGIVMPSAFDPDTGKELWRLELLSEGRANEYDYDKVITRHETRIAMSLLAGAAMLGHDKVGSFALSSTKWESELAMGLNAWLDAMFAVWNRHAIPRLYALNGWPMDRMCSIVHEEIQSQDVEALANAALHLSQAGMDLFPDEELENHIRDEMGWPQLVEGQWEERQAQQDQEDAQNWHLQLQQARAGAVAGPGKPGGPPGGAKPPAGGVPPKPGGKPPTGPPAGPSAGRSAHAGPGTGVRTVKKANARTSRGRYDRQAATAPPSVNVSAAVGVLRDRLAVNGRGDIDHGFVSVPELPETKGWRENVDAAAVLRVPIKGLIATQPTVRRDHVRTFIENPDVVMPGQRSLTGQHEDKPVLYAKGGKAYILDGHHRLTARAMMGYPDTMARVIDGDALPANQGERRDLGGV